MPILSEARINMLEQVKDTTIWDQRRMLVFDSGELDRQIRFVLPLFTLMQVTLGALASFGPTCGWISLGGLRVPVIVKLSRTLKTNC